MWIIKVPTKVLISRKKPFILNLNHYRNAHHHTLSDAKIDFDQQVSPLVRGLPPMEAVNLTFRLFTRTLAKADTSNVCCIVDKFFCDTLVKAGVLKDDNNTVVLSAIYRYGGHDKSDPRVEVTIEPVGISPFGSNLET